MTKSLLDADYAKLELRVAGTQIGRWFPIEHSAVYMQIKRVVHATEKAFLVETEDGTGWIPKACCRLMATDLMLVDRDFDFRPTKDFEEEEPPCPYCGSYTYCGCAS